MAMSMRLARTFAVVPVFTGIAAAQTPQLNVEWSWSEVAAGTTVPVTSPNGVLEPGESVLFRLSVSFEPPVGTPLPVPGYPNATVAGLGSVLFALYGRLESDPFVAAPGAFSHLGRRTEWRFGSPLGEPTPGVAEIRHAGFGQFPLAGQTANPENPIENVWQAVWTPAEYRIDTYNFFSAHETPLGAGFLLLQTGIDPITSAPLYEQVYGIPSPQGGVQIPMVPAPGAGVAGLVMVSLLAWRRQR
jgi:hypothetical protein